jgi:hypothetical protein
VKPCAVYRLSALAVIILGLSRDLPAKDRHWMSGTVIAVEHLSARAFQSKPSVEYTTRSDGVEYVVQKVALTYFSESPREIFAIGDRVEISPDGDKYAFIKTDSGEV